MKSTFQRIGKVFRILFHKYVWMPIIIAREVIKMRKNETFEIESVDLIGKRCVQKLTIVAMCDCENVKLDTNVEEKEEVKNG